MNVGNTEIAVSVGDDKDVGLLIGGGSGDGMPSTLPLEKGVLCADTGVSSGNERATPRLCRWVLYQKHHAKTNGTLWSNCSRLRGRVGLQSKFRAWLPLCKRPDGP